jgi:hypothetical protein
VQIFAIPREQCAALLACFDYTPLGSVAPFDSAPLRSGHAQHDGWNYFPIPYSIVHLFTCSFA